MGSGSKIQNRLGAAPLAKPFWLGMAVLFVAIGITAHPQNVESTIGAAAIIIAGFVPFGIWTLRNLGGIPVFPIFAATHVTAFGLPLLYEHPIITKFEPERQLFAAGTVTVFLICATVVWNQTRSKNVKSVPRYLGLEANTADTFFLASMAGSIVLTMALNAAWFDLPFGIYTIIKAIMIALEALACFVLSYRLGRAELGSGTGWLFKALLVGLIITSLPSLYLVTPITFAGISALGYVSGSGKIPWFSMLAAVAVIGFLHAGKGDMRQRYWEESDDDLVQPWEYPSFIGSWAESSTDAMFGDIADDDEKSTGIFERASLMQLLIFEQDVCPDHLPFMWGETYAYIPLMFIPRIIFPEKPEAHAGTHMLNVYFGLQTEEESEHTTVGFGLLNEAFANFGYFGIAGLAVLVGFFCGWVERMATGVPLLSFRGLFAVIVAAEAFQVEHAAGVVAGVFFQQIVALIIIAVIFMRKRSSIEETPVQAFEAWRPAPLPASS